MEVDCSFEESAQRLVISSRSARGFPRTSAAITARTSARRSPNRLPSRRGRACGRSCARRVSAGPTGSVGGGACRRPGAGRGGEDGLATGGGGAMACWGGGAGGRCAADRREATFEAAICLRAFETILEITPTTTTSTQTIAPMSRTRYALPISLDWAEATEAAIDRRRLRRCRRSTSACRYLLGCS